MIGKNHTETGGENEKEVGQIREERVRIKEIKGERL